MPATFKLGFYDPPVPFEASDQVKVDAPLITAESREISASTLNHEIVQARVDWTGAALMEDKTVTIQYFNSDTGFEIFTFQFAFKKGWTQAWAMAWIGHKDRGEIDRPGNYHVTLSSPELFSKTLTFKITTAPYYITEIEKEAGKLPGFWEDLKPLLKDAFKVYEVINWGPVIFSLEWTSRTIFGKELIESTAREWLGLVPGLEALYKLFTGKKLDGTVEAFGTTEDYIDLALLVITIALTAYGGKIISAIMKKLDPKGLTKLGDAVIARKATPQQIEAILRSDNYEHVMRAIRAEPAAWAELTAKLSPDARNIVMASMRQMADPTAFTLTKQALLDLAAAKPVWQTVLAGMQKPKTIAYGLGGILSLLGLAYGIAFGTEWFAKEGLFEMAFIPTTDRMRDYRDSPTEEKKKRLLQDLDKLRTLVPLAQALISGISWLWPFTRDEWLEYADAIEYEVNSIEDELETIEIPAVSEEERWKEIYEEQDKRRDERQKEEELYWQKLQDETAAEKAAARAEEQRYWEDVKKKNEAEQERIRREEELYWQKVREESLEAQRLRQVEAEDYYAKLTADADKRRAEVRAEEELYWERIQEESEAREAAARTEEEAYWERIREENAARDAEERAAEQAYWEAIRAANEAAEVGASPYVATYTPVYTAAYPEQIQQALSYMSKAVSALSYYPAVAEPTEYVARRSLILNIETTGASPFTDRIIAIGLQDPLDPGVAPSVILLPSEVEMLNLFFDTFLSGNYTQLIGWNISFDFRFLIVKAMYYNITCREFAVADLYDLNEVMSKGKLGYVFRTQVTPSLSNVADYFFTFPKPFSDAKMIEYYAKDELEPVMQFASEQVTRTLLVYLLFQYISQTQITPIAPGSAGAAFSVGLTPNILAEASPALSQETIKKAWTAKCPYCLAEKMVSESETETYCDICKTRIERGAA